MNSGANRDLTRRCLCLAALAGTTLAALAACGAAPGEASGTISSEAATATPAAPTDNLARELPSLPEMRRGLTAAYQAYTETGRLDRVVYDAAVPAGHVLNYYLDELPATGWTEVSRSQLTVRGGTLEYRHPTTGQHLKITVTGPVEGSSTTTLELDTPSSGPG